MEKMTFVLDGLALAGRGTFGDSPADKNNEFFDAGPLEVPKMTHIGRVC